MPRSRRSSSPARHSSTAHHPPPPAKAPPPPAQHSAPPPAHSQPQQSGGILSGIGSTIMQGMAFGTGSSMAHHAVGALVGSGSNSKHETKPEESHPQTEKDVRTANVCQPDMDAFKRCMKENNDNAAACEFYYNALQQCQAYNPEATFN